MADTAKALAATIARNAKQRRTALRLTVENVASSAGIARSTVSDIENGRGERLAIMTLLKLAAALEMPPSALLGMDLGRATFTDQEVALIVAHRRIFGRASPPPVNP